MIGLDPPQIWYNSILPSLKNVAINSQRKKRARKIINSTSHCAILLKFSTLMHYLSMEPIS